VPLGEQLVQLVSFQVEVDMQRLIVQETTNRVFKRFFDGLNGQCVGVGHNGFLSVWPIPDESRIGG
jgi:hypothetical protein